jgi:hypothetical protein
MEAYDFKVALPKKHLDRLSEELTGFTGNMLIDGQ